MNRRIVVTGMGAVTPVGNNLQETWQNLINGRSGVGAITYFDHRAHNVHIAGEARAWDPLAHFSRKELRRTDPFARFAIVAAREAVAQARLKITDDNRYRVGVLVGSGVGGLGTYTEEFKVLAGKGPSRISPLLIPLIIIDSAGTRIAMEFGMRGPNYAVVSACSTGANAISTAYYHLRASAADVMVAGGSEAAITPMGIAAFDRMRALSHRNDEPQRASRPFDVQRDGFVMGEGAGVMVLETLEHALKRGAVPLAELIGYGSTNDAYHIAAPLDTGEGAAAAMRAAFADANIQPSDVDYINAHGTSTSLNDPIETAVIKEVLGEHAYNVPVSSIKSMIGHTLGAAGAIEALASIQAIRAGIVPPTINYEFPDPKCDLDYVPNVAREANIRVAVSNSFGFGGHNSVLVFRKYEDEGSTDEH